MPRYISLAFAAACILPMQQAVRADSPCPDLVISELMAKNVHGLKDSDGTYQDWIEIQNPCQPSVSLNGWYLTDDAQNLTKWRFPGVSLALGDFLIVFASGKNLAVAGQELHTNFELSSDGEFLALVRPDGITIQQQFAPKYPSQVLDISYGSPQTATTLVDHGAPATFHVPTIDDAVLGDAWAASTFNDETWVSGQTGHGFLISSNSQLSVTYYKANISVGSLALAETVISDVTKQTSVVATQSATINYLNTGGGAHFAADAPFPSTTIGVNVEDFVVLVTGTVVIPSAGNWTFGVNSDDGFGLQLTKGATTFSASFPSPRGPGDTFGVFNIAEPGPYQVRLVFYERGGGAELEFFAAQGSHSSFNSSFRLVGDTANGGLSVAGFGGEVHTDVQPAMQNVNASLWTRVPFTVANPVSVSKLLLGMRYEDGFVAYLNGQEVARRNAPATVVWNSSAASDRPVAQSYSYEIVDLSPSISLLQAGGNTLAVHGLNDSAADGDFLIVPTLVSIEGVIDTATQRFFTTPTPGAYNNAGYPDFAGGVQCSRASGTFTASFSVTITTGSPSATIRYTLDGSVPTETTGTLYAGPIAVSTTTQIRARAFEAGLAPGPLLGRTYIKLDPAIQGFSSNLPIVIVDNFGAGLPNTDVRQPAFWALFEPTNNGRSLLTVDPTITSRSGITDRGSSTAGQPKRNLSVETRDEYEEDSDIAPLGMPAESDWILYAPYHYDRALIRNAFVYALSNQMGRYAVRTRFVEVFANYNGGPLTQSSYAGIYVFMEKIKRGPGRVDIEKLEPQHQAEPEITGGWALKIDRPDPGDVGFTGGNQGIRYVEPKEYEVVDSQAVWIKNYFDTFYNTLNGPAFTDPVNGYAKYIDPDSWVDHHILDVVSKNVDGLRLSTYMFMRRNSRLEMGPAWDYDRSMDSYDGRDDAANTWNGTGDATQFFTYPWWGRLFQDPDFWQKWIDRWAQLRTAQLSVSNMNGVIDGMAAELLEASARNTAAWPSVAPAGGNLLNETDHLKQWMTDRVNWIDTQFTAAPTSNHAAGVIPYGFNLTLSAPAGTIYYTLNDTDPRLPGGGISPSAAAYSTPFVLNSATHIRARALNSAAWSAPLDAAYFLSFATSPQVVINEIMYNPAGAANTEFVELHNLSTTDAVDLSGWRLNGVGLVFANGTILPPSAYGVVVGDATAFASAYGGGILVLAAYSGALDNGGETLTLLDSAHAVMDKVTYDDDPPWPGSADGTGPSLELIDATRDNNRVGNWAASVGAGGTPGAANSRAGSLPPIPNVYINEVLSNNQSVNQDELGGFDPWIELHNPTTEAIDLTGLYLTDHYGQPAKWPFAPGTELCAGQWMLVWADNQPAQGALHTNFTLNAAGGSVGLYDSAGRPVDSLNYPALSANVSYGRFPDASPNRVPFPTPTPAAANSAFTAPVILNEYNAVIPTGFIKNGASDSFFGRVVGNGGDWFELVVTKNHVDMRGWKLVVVDNAGPSQQSVTLTLTNHAIWSDLRSGTIITVAEDLPDDVSYNPLGGDWWINVRASAAGTGAYISAANFNVTQNNTQITIRNALNQVMFGPAGEGVQPASGIGNDEVFKLEEDPSEFITPLSNYNDGSSSTFGSPNVFNSGTQSQDFSVLRSGVFACDDHGDCADDDPCTVDACLNGECYHAAASPCYRLSLDVVGSTQRCPGAMDVRVNLAGLVSPLNGAQVLLHYDAARLALLSVTPGDGAGSPWNAAMPVASSDSGGDVTYALALLGGNTTSDGTVATLHFDVLNPGDDLSTTRVTFRTPASCSPLRTKLTTATNQTILPTTVDSAAISVGPRVTVNIDVEGLNHAVTRDVTFILTECSGLVSQTLTKPVAFNAAGHGSVVLTSISPHAAWICAYEGHTLRKRRPLAYTSCAATVDFTGAQRLISGDFRTAAVAQDNFVDIVDFAILSARWGTAVSDCASGPPASCGYGADVSGDGVQETADFNAIQAHFFENGDDDHGCPAPPLGSPGRPTVRPLPRPMAEAPKEQVRTAEWAGRVADIQRADLNGDGIINLLDVRDFAAKRQLRLLPAMADRIRRVELSAAAVEEAAPAATEK